MKIFIYFLFSISFLSCNSLKFDKNLKFEEEFLIDVVIRDFIKSNEFKKEKVFSLLPRKKDGVFSVLVIESSEIRYLYSIDKKPNEQKLPNRFYTFEDKVIIIDYNDTDEVDEKTISLLKNYNLLQDDGGGLVLAPDNIIDETKKGTTYHFCIERPYVNKKIFSRQTTYNKLNCK
jgi:hypothetical protein